MYDLTVLLLVPDMDERPLARSLQAVSRLMTDSGLSVDCLVVELLQPGTDVTLLRRQPIEALPAVLRRALEREDFGYLVQYDSTDPAALRRAVRSARGHHVCVMRAGDEPGFRVGGDQRLKERRHDLLLGLPGTGGAALQAHRALADAARSHRAIPSLAALASYYDGALVVRRDLLDDALGEVGDRCATAYMGCVNQVLVETLLRSSGRIAFTEQWAVFPATAHAVAHRRCVVGPMLPAVMALRGTRRGGFEPATETLIDGLLARWMALGQPGAAHSAIAPKTEVARCLEGELTAATDRLLRWCYAQVRRLWDTDGSRPLPSPPALPQVVVDGPSPLVSLVSSAFRGQRLVHGFMANLVGQQGFDQCELLVVSPEANLVQDLVCEHFALSLHQVRALPLDQDPGIYGCWNLALSQARGRYASNANLDDRRDLHHVSALVEALESTGADVASSGLAITHDLQRLMAFDGDLSNTPRVAGKVWFCENAVPLEHKSLTDFFVFDKDGAMQQCNNFPHCMPVWRTDLHQRFGHFDEARHGTYADFAFWLAVASGGGRFVHLPRPLGLYFIDPQSHNRRNADLITWQAVVQPHLPPGVRIRPSEHVAQAAAAPRSAPTDKPRDGRVRLNFGQELAQTFGTHRSGWSYAMQAFEPFHDPTAPVLCDPFIEKHFVWGAHPGEGGAGPVKPRSTPWIGFVHVPPHVPRWFQYEQSNQQIFSRESWARSLPHCRGLFTLTEYHRQHLLQLLQPDFPISVVYHPTEFPPQQFDLDRFKANPHKRLVQIGWWLRKLTAIDQVRAQGLHPTLLGGADWMKNMLAHAERRYHALTQPSHVETLDFLPNDAYDELLTENLVFIDFYDTSANNAVIECIARGTPIVVCRHAAVEEYLGRDYPLFYDSVDRIGSLVNDEGRLRAAVAHLNRPDIRGRLTLERFTQDFLASEVIRHAT